jgi:hypothetical protein
MVDALVTQQPLLLVEDVEEVLAELSRWVLTAKGSLFYERTAGCGPGILQWAGPRAGGGGGGWVCCAARGGGRLQGAHDPCGPSPRCRRLMPTADPAQALLRDPGLADSLACNRSLSIW